jgi:lysyl-tRNA synthetase class 2
MRKVRQSVHRLERDGYTVTVLRRRELDGALLEQLQAVSEQWLGGQGERGFSMALDDPWAAEHGECVFAIALDPTGTPAGYIHFVPVLATGDLSLSSMRRREDTPNGLNEAILSGAFAWARDQGIERVGLNFSAFGRILRAPELQGWERLAAQALLQGDRWFQLERLDAFNRKFLPTWEPRVAAYERTVDLPQAALAILAAEGLLPVPRLPSFGSDAPSAEPAR